MLDQHDVASFSHDTIQVDLDRALMAAFCRALDASCLTPMTIMSAMAGALGSVYRQVAGSHQNQPCPCGWQPTSAQDLTVLQSTFTAAATLQPVDTLLTMRTMGRA